MAKLTQKIDKAGRTEIQVLQKEVKLLRDTLQSLLLTTAEVVKLAEFLVSKDRLAP